MKKKNTSHKMATEKAPLSFVINSLTENLAKYADMYARIERGEDLGEDLFGDKYTLDLVLGNIEGTTRDLFRAVTYKQCEDCGKRMSKYGTSLHTEYRICNECAAKLPDPLAGMMSDIGIDQ